MKRRVVSPSVQLPSTMPFMPDCGGNWVLFLVCDATMLSQRWLRKLGIFPRGRQIATFFVAVIRGLAQAKGGVDVDKETPGKDEDRKLGVGRLLW